ncbi:PLP-dependent aminotransferase family protein [Granulosicoccus antarcticus]|uniref:2-aminoadipate transaminase n=1 Tax=Granulosicoccus antarcticus IMCC3135 TaxID=1192854 RepID=A0A2Z2P0R5_9GAMM|nr:PLP-dependent aminotransferase family protein [Granulosicoccus antarcticus]ASJ73104.1 2-aminoadipate transaminase [Granulosicoccus antarcticus IMCC3135]
MSVISLSKRVSNLHSSPIREVLAVANKPGMISFAGGLPSADSFPRMDILQMPRQMLQYGPSEGEPELRDLIATELQNIELDVKPENIIVLSGSQQGIDLVAKLFIDHGTRVALQSPSYLAALQAFRFYGMHAVALDPDAPEQALSGDGNHPALAYINPTFQNPTGHCWSTQQRLQFASLADKTGVAVFEDDPYRDLVYEQIDRTPVCAKLKKTSWIYQSSFSKNLAPGLRLGFLAASDDLVPYLLRLKQAADLHSSRVSQWLVLQELNKVSRAEQLHTLAAQYLLKRDHFQALLLEHFSDLAVWQVPTGGLFFWLKLNTTINTSELLASAISQNVAFMPGEPFFLDPQSGYSAIRLNFSHASADEATKGLSVLSALIRNNT